LRLLGRGPYVAQGCLQVIPCRRLDEKLVDAHTSSLILITLRAVPAHRRDERAPGRQGRSHGRRHVVAADVRQAERLRGETDALFPEAMKELEAQVTAAAAKRRSGEAAKAS